MRLSVLFFLFFLSFTLSGQLSITGSLVESQEGEYPTLEDNISQFEIYKIENLDRLSLEAQGSSFITDLILGDRSYRLSLYKDNLKTSFEKPNKPFCLGGSLNIGGTVSLTLNDNFIFGFLREGSSKYYIEPLSHFEDGVDEQLFVFYNVHDVIETGEHVCGVSEVEKRNTKVPDHILKMPTTMCKVVEYAIANDYDMVIEFGNSTSVMNFNLGVLNDVQTNYRSEFDANLEYDVVAHYVPASAANNPYTPNSPPTDNGSTLLSRFRTWADGGGNNGGATGGFAVDYNMAGVWRDTDFCAIINGTCNFGVVGIAYTPGWHHILENYTTSAPSLNVMVSHEIGHNWNCLHDGAGTDFIMAPSVTLTDNWSAASQTAINNRVAAQTYLADCSTLGAPNANYFQSALAVCTNIDIEFEDQSQYGATRDWVFTSGNPATSTDEKPLVDWSMTGLFFTEITSANATGTDKDTSYVDIQNEPPTPCTPSGSGGSAGVEFFNLANISNASSSSGIYDNFSCSEVALLLADTQYDVIFTAEQISWIRFFIDFNNDGDFTDTEDFVSGSFFLSNPNGTYQIPNLFTTPVSPVLGSLIRLRIIGSSTNNITSTGCTSPSTGQVEDYSVYFEAAQVFGCTDPAANNYDPNATVDNGSCTYGLQTWYEDSDSDSFGNPNVSQQSASQPMGYVLDNTDCDDTDALEFPGQTWYKDNDGDTYSDGVTQIQCNRPANYYAASELNGLTNDCDDNDANAFPGNPEVCDGIDNDCDGNIDEGVQTTFYQDFDGDGFGNPNVSLMDCSAPPGYVTNNSDCDDSDALEFPGQVWFRDADGDQHGDGTSQMQCTRPANYYAASELISVDLDCDDNNANAFPGNPEVCDGVDNNCDGNIDEGLLTTYYQDSDGDGYGNPGSSTQACSQPTGYVSNNSDCNDSDALEFPGQTWYKDLDSDLYGDGTMLMQCSRPAGYYAASELTQLDTDCNDNNNLINPGVSEVCYDSIDNNCDGNVDEGCTAPPDCDGVNLFISNVTEAEYGAEISLTSDAVVDFGSSVLFAAGSVIDLEAGFEVVSGQAFEALILPCNNTFNDPNNDENSASSSIEDKELESIKNQMLESFGPEHQVQFKVLDRWGEQQYSQQSSLQAIGNDGLDSLRQKLEPGQYMVVIKVGDESRRFVLSVAGN